MSYGFIITRHVNSVITNNYWNHCVQCIRHFYSPENYKIVVIDDNSNKSFLKSEYEYKNVEYVQSEFPGRGELLPYYYYYKNNYFDNAVIIHDSVFFQSKINFSRIPFPVLPLWHFSEEKSENLPNSLRLLQFLKNNYYIQKKIIGTNKYDVLSFNNKKDSFGCFGVQSYINYHFLETLQNKYAIFNLLKVVKNREDRCCLERIMCAIFYNEIKELIQIKSLLGSIQTYGPWGFTWNEYWKKLTNKQKPSKPLIKVWTGR